MNLKPEQLKQNAAAMIAFAEGKPIEFQDRNGEWLRTGGLHSFLEYPHRPAPWTLPDPPAGHQWHRTDFTKADLPEGWRPLLLGEIEQREDQYLCWGTWESDPCRGGATTQDNKRRTRRPLPTEPKMVPWDAPEDVPGPVCWIRRKSNPSTIRLIVGISLCDICDSQEGEETWASLAARCEHSTDRKTWLPCTKPAQP